MKKVLCILLSIALVISGLWFIAPKHATADADFAITTPVAGSLKAAGYIDIEWEDASVINEVENYEVYIDGSLMTTTTECKYEFYTTKVYFHKAWVKANFKDGTDHYTKTVRFGVTKKGLAIETNMAAFKIVPKDMGVAWYYNWGRPSYYYNQLYKDLEYVPMVWGDTNIASLRNKIESAVNSNYKYILGYNEPDMGSSAGGCNIDTDTVISLWQHFVAYKDQIKIGSPAYALWSNVSTSKFPTFMAGVENNVDFVCIHCYPADWNGGKAMADWLLKDVIQDTYDRYQKPIWITEYSTSGNGITQDGTAEFVKYFNEGVNQEKYDYVERHSFFSFNADTFGGGLYSYSTGELSKSGEAYAKYGNPEKDYVTGEYVNPRDAEDPTTVAPTESTTAKPTPKPTTKKTVKVKKPGKAKISKAKYKKKRKITLKFKKILRAKGYNIRYSDVKSFDGYWEKNTKKTKFTLKKLDKNTKYYIKVRAYNYNNKVKQFGKWSKVKKVKVKK